MRVVRANASMVGLDEIKQILFHRGPMLLLDSVQIHNGRAYGRYKVGNQYCQNHEPLPGLPLMRGVDITEAGFQLLGVLISKADGLEGLDRKMFVARESGASKFARPVRVGDDLVLETDSCINMAEASGVWKLTSSRIIAMVGPTRVAAIDFLVIAAVDRPV